ncbi:MAG: alkene reductase, partial [Bacteroidota bacterium]
MILLKPTILGQLQLNNKMVMSAMTRARADINGVVKEITATYYGQRASAGLIISEATN